MDLPVLPTLNACLNAVATVLLLRGRALVRAGQIDAHRRTMITAFVVSAVFLASYLTHKTLQDFENTTFHVEGWAKTAYLLFLASHVLLAMTVPVFALMLIRYGLTDRIDQHRRLARVAWPIWMYVSVTGVVIYLLLYPLNPGP